MRGQKEIEIGGKGGGNGKFKLIISEKFFQTICFYIKYENTNKPTTKKLFFF